MPTVDLLVSCDRNRLKVCSGSGKSHGCEWMCWLGKIWSLITYRLQACLEKNCHLSQSSLTPGRRFCSFIYTVGGCHYDVRYFNVATFVSLLTEGGYCWQDFIGPGEETAVFVDDHPNCDQWEEQLKTSDCHCLNYCDDGSSMVLQNIIKFVLDYMTSHSRRQ